MRAAATLLAVVAAAVGAALWWRGRTDHLSPAAAGAALQARLHVPYPYRCHRISNDGTIELARVDYACSPVGRPQAPGYWIGTTRHGIVDLLPSG